ncbi:MAG: hypothetical protein ACE5R4_15420, partial [Armatimonadota bacterium]
GCGLTVLRVALQDVHPPVEAVAAFRDVASAREEKEKKINEAQGYQNQQVRRAAGEAEAELIKAEGYAARRTEHARGEAARFARQAAAYRLGPQVTRTRLYLSTIEEALAPSRKMILDAKSTRARQMMFVEQGALTVAVPEAQPAEPAEQPPTETPPLPPEPPPEAAAPPETETSPQPPAPEEGAP